MLAGAWWAEEAGLIWGDGRRGEDGRRSGWGGGSPALPPPPRPPPPTNSNSELSRDPPFPSRAAGVTDIIAAAAESE